MSHSKATFAGVPVNVTLLFSRDCETVLARFSQAGIKLEALASQLQVEGAKSFVESRHELLTVIASKSNALKKGELHAVSAN